MNYAVQFNEAVKMSKYYKRLQAERLQKIRNLEEERRKLNAEIDQLRANHRANIKHHNKAKRNVGYFSEKHRYQFNKTHMHPAAYAFALHMRPGGPWYREEIAKNAHVQPPSKKRPRNNNFQPVGPLGVPPWLA
jgi:hypothetical protein